MAKLIHKGGLTIRKGIDVDNALVPAKVSVLEIDRDNEVTMPQGFRHREGLRHFKTNPTVYFGHQSYGLPIGKANQLALADDHIAAVTKLAVDVQGPIGDHVRGVFDLMTQGFLNAWSIGFWFDDFATEPDAMRAVLEAVNNDAAKAVLKGLDGVRRIFTRNRLAEYSSVGIGSSPSSLTERGYTGHELAPEIKELLEFGAKYDAAKDNDWVEWLRYTESASIDLDPEPVVATDVECDVIDRCTVYLDEIKGQADDDDDKAKPPDVTATPAFREAVAAATKELLAATKHEPPDQPIHVGDKLQAKLDEAGITVVWHAGKIALQVELDDDEFGEKVVVPIDGDTLAAINAKAETLSSLAVLEGLTGDAGE